LLYHRCRSSACGARGARTFVGFISWRSSGQFVKQPNQKESFMGEAPAAGTDAPKRKRGAGKADKGRTGRDGQEAVLQPGIIVDAIDNLEKLYVKSQEAGKDLNNAIKKVAEKSGYLASNIRAFVAARVGDKFADKKRDAEQQLELFEEVGE
jgi:hypothetical protein